MAKDTIHRGQFILNQSKRDWQIWRWAIGDGFPHAHYNNRKAAEALIDKLCAGECPSPGSYGMKAAKRLLTYTEYESLTPAKIKQKYKNNSRR